MSVIRMPEAVWSAVRHHLYARRGEHFAFLRANWASTKGGPIFIVRDTILVPDADVVVGRDGWRLKTDAILRVINQVVGTHEALIEVHNHGGEMPRFSGTDLAGLREFPSYVLDSLRGRPYAATVWGDRTVFGSFFEPGGRQGSIRSITVFGDRLRQVVSRDDDLRPADAAFDRQFPWFAAEGQRALARLKVGVVGVGGTGSQLVQNLVYLGCRDFVVIEHDHADETSMNRLVTADAADIDTLKAVLGRRLVRRVAPEARVTVEVGRLPSSRALSLLKDADVVFGCVDNDGARLVLNELALAYGVPLFDLAVGIAVDGGQVAEVGGRLAVVIPGGPCLCCMGEIDVDEARYFLSSDQERLVQRERGYVRGMDVQAPAVVSLNATIAAAAATEFAILVSGVRPVNVYTEFDALGVGRPLRAQWMTPTKVTRVPDCVQCAAAGAADAADLERYARAVSGDGRN